jgi:uncharacterized OsmC-like protein
MHAAKSAPLVERSLVSVQAGPGRTKFVTLPTDRQAVPMGMRDGVAGHYKVPAGAYVPHATTLDYVVGATAACLAGTFGGMLEQLGQPITDGELTATAEGQIVKDGGVLRIASVTVHYRVLRCEEVAARDIERAHQRHAKHCPIAHTIGGCVDIRTSLDIIDAADER